MCHESSMVSNMATILNMFNAKVWDTWMCLISTLISLCMLLLANIFFTFLPHANIGNGFHLTNTNDMPFEVHMVPDCLQYLYVGCIHQYLYKFVFYLNQCGILLFSWTMQFHYINASIRDVIDLVHWLWLVIQIIEHALHILKHRVWL